MKWMPPMPERNYFLRAELFIRNNHPSRLSTTEIIDSVTACAKEYYDREIRQLFENAVEVGCFRYAPNEWAANSEKDKCNTHKALMINIQPIKEESAGNELIKEMMNYLSRHYPLMDHPTDEKYRAALAARAKAHLEQQK